MGRPLDYRVWARRSAPAAYVGTFRDPAGQTACVFADPRSGRAIGPLNLRLGRPAAYACPAPRVGPPPAAEPGRLGLLEYYRVEWEGHRSGPDREERGVFLRFEPGPESMELAERVVDGLLLGLLALEPRIAALSDPMDVERAHWGLILAGAKDVALRHVGLLKRKLEKESWHELAAVTGLVFGALADVPAFRWKGGWPEAFHALRKGKPLPPAALEGWEVVEPGVLRHEEWHSPESCVEPDAGPFAPGPYEGVRFLRAAGDGIYKASMRSLPRAVEADAIALGPDALGRLAVAPGLELLRGCAPQDVEGFRFGDVLRLIRQDDRIAWAERTGRDAAKAVDLLRADGSTRAKALLARAAELGACGWDAWDGAGVKIREALATNPSVEHARRLEPFLPGEGDSNERLRALLTAVAVYWRAGAFEDAWILLGRMPNLLPETKDAPALRASRFLHGLLEGRHVHDATEEARNELSYVWDGTLNPVVDALGQPLSGRCVEVLDHAGL